MFLSGSPTECQPLTVLDAMAAGTPFVARATGCINILPGGLAVDGATEAARALNRILEPELWHVYSAAGLNAANERFHPIRVGDKLAMVLRQILQP